MTRRYLPLKSLRAFEAAARHLSFTNAAIELNVTHSAISQQVKQLEALLHCPLFIRVPRGLMLTPEAEHLLPVLLDSFDRIASSLDFFHARQVREKLSIGVVGTFASGFLLPRLSRFQLRYPHIELQLSTNNNRLDIAAEGLDLAIRFGSGAWHGVEAHFLCESPLTPLCAEAIAAKLKQPADLLQFSLLRSYRKDEWRSWLQKAGGPSLPPAHPMVMFDSSVTMLAAAEQGFGVALAPVAMFRHLLAQGRIVQPFATELTLGSYWLTRLQSKAETAAMREFSQWLFAEMTMPDECG
jgi:LysR family transcriptional regulator of beta-lactamase